MSASSMAAPGARVRPTPRVGTATAAPAASPDVARDEVRRQVRMLLEESPAFRALSADKQREIAHHTVQVCDYLAAPEGIPGHTIAKASAARALAGEDVAEDIVQGKFTAQGVREGAAAAGVFLQAVNFPSFVSQLIQGVFHSIVQSSIQQMEEYGKLVKSVAMTLNQFRDENVTANQGRDHLVEQFPELFRIDVDTGEDGEQPRVRLRDGVDEDAALRRVSHLPVEGGALSSLDDESIEEKLVPAARTSLATSRQQLLATMVLMGINRIVVTDGRIAAKVLFDFQARDNFKYAYSATKFDYGEQYKYTGEGESESETEGGSRTHSRESTGSGADRKTSMDTEERDASYYYKGKYKYSNEPVLKLASATQAATDAALSTKASLTGQVEVNFKSETFPLEKLADSFQIGRIQDAAKPGAANAAPGAPGATAQPTAGSTAPTPTPAPANAPANAPATR